MHVYRLYRAKLSKPFNTCLRDVWGVGMSRNEQQLTTVSWLMAIGVLALLVTAQQFVHDQQTEELLNRYEVSNRGITQCLPEDTGVKSILTLEQRGGGLFLNCEKHERVSFATATKTQARFLSLAVPVSVE